MLHSTLHYQNSYQTELKGLSLTLQTGRPPALVFGACTGAVIGLPLIAALVFAVDQYSPTEMRKNIIELVMSSLALIASLVYLVQTCYVMDKSILQVLRTSGAVNTELVLFVMIPFVLYMGVAVAAQITIMYQAVHQYQYDKMPIVSNGANTPTPPPTAPPFTVYLDDTTKAIIIAQSLVYILNVILEFGNIMLHIIGYRTFSNLRMSVFTAGLCLGYLTSFSFVAFLVDINTTWSSGNASYDNMLCSAYISFRFFTFCVFLNMAFLQPIRTVGGKLTYLRQQNVQFNDMPDMVKSYKKVEVA